MSFPRIFLFSSIALFAVITIVGVGKKGRVKSKIPVSTQAVQEIEFIADQSDVVFQTPKPKEPTAPPSKKNKKEKVKKNQLEAKAENLPNANYIESFFDPAAIKLPIVETITYSRRVPWLKGKFAWVSDYASHFKTSKHFIARSLNKKPDYFTQDVKEKDRFNVLRIDKDFTFYLVIDVSRCKMWFYFIDNDENQTTLVKTYDVGLGRSDEMKASGSLTPLGKFSLGDKIAVYKPGITGFFNNEKTEMVRIFGTRWIPFHEEIEGCTAPAKGFGIHGAPWAYNPETKTYQEDLADIGAYESDGCIRLSQSDIEELFAIIVSRPTVIELVKDFYEASLLGQEQQSD